MLIPKKVKYRKHQRGTNKGIAVRGSTISFGEFALKAEKNGKLSEFKANSIKKYVFGKLKSNPLLFLKNLF